MKRMHKRWKKWLVGIGMTIAVAIPIAADDNYFELSKNLEILSDIYKELNVYYVDEINPNALMRTGIDAMLSSLDPYTVYYSEAEMQNFRFQTTGKYGGIGAIIRKKGDYMAIMEPYENSPAVKAGLMAGDLIIAIEGTPTKDKSVEEVSTLLRGSPGTTVDLRIRRAGFEEDQIFTVEREDVGLENVPYEGFIAPGYAYIRLNQFTQDAGKHIEDAYQRLDDQQDIKGLILDLRGNPGGLLHEAVNICNLFIEKNKLVVSTKGKVKEWNRDFKTLNKPMDLEVPITVLINETSASASEIVAGTLQDYDRAVIIGKRSFGKGLVQQTRDIAYNTKLKLTTAKYYTPSGRCIQAIDYSHRNEDGTLSKIPDSVKSSFTTENGRIVYDGGGIEPDIEVETSPLANVTKSLLVNDLIFDYATQYRLTHDSIANPAQFYVNNETYSAFRQFLTNKAFHYESKTEALLIKLKEEAQAEKLYASINNQIETMEKELAAAKQNDLITFKDEITELLEEEIVSRYYFQRGTIQASFDDDPFIASALKVLKDKQQYHQILQQP